MVRKIYKNGEVYYSSKVEGCVREKLIIDKKNEPHTHTHRERERERWGGV